ncbi:GNAT family N-acetyltransferase [Propionibacteriaceae bacterium Y2011]
MIPLRTTRLSLRAFAESDEQFVLGLHQNPELARFMPTQVLTDLDGARKRIDRFRRHDDHPVYGFWCVTRLDGTPVGLVLFQPIPASEGVGVDDVEIGWRQHAAHTGRGYVTEAARAVLDHGFATGLDRIVAVTDPANRASQRVCERLAMRYEGLTRDYYDTESSLFVATRS